MNRDRKKRREEREKQRAGGSRGGKDMQKDGEEGRETLRLQKSIRGRIKVLISAF